MSSALASARSVWEDKCKHKRQRLGEAEPGNLKEDSNSIQISKEAVDKRPQSLLPGPSSPSQMPDTMHILPAEPELSTVDPSFANLSQTPGAIHPTDPETSTVDSSLDRPVAERKGRRVIRKPARFRDEVPEPPAPLPFSDISDPPSGTSVTPDSPLPSPSSPSIVQRIGTRTLTSPRNTFGLFRKYMADNFPSHDPEEELTSADLQDGEYTRKGADIYDLGAPSPPSTQTKFGPYPNQSSFLLGEWFWNGGVQKSKSGFKQLLNIVSSPSFRPADVRDTSWDHIDQQLGDSNEDNEEWTDVEFDATWIRTPVEIQVPFHSRSANAGVQTYVVPDFFHRSITSIIKEKLTNIQEFRHFHLEPFELHWQPGQSAQPTRVHGELYTSPAFLEAHQEIQSSPPEPSCTLPRHVVALMFASDATHLTSFGDAKIWPLYMFFGNDSKYRRSKPSLHLCNHVAYFQKLPDSFKDFATPHAGTKGASDALITHCLRELFHAQWDIIFDDDFLEAYKHGMVVLCPDDLLRRFYPRIFIYSADYPEKILLASIRNLGLCPCPRCVIPMSSAPNLGTAEDREQRRSLARKDDVAYRTKISDARDLIYVRSYAVSNDRVEAKLKEQSLTPNMNAFSRRLSPFGFNMFSMLVVDLMHEVELGSWRSLFIHLLRILEVEGQGLLHELDRRYRAIPTYGRDTIRKFSKNCSELKHMAARDFEDLLQCAIPVFEGLLPEPYNEQILELLFLLGHWHGFGKLRMHTDDTLGILDNNTSLLGAQFREFHDFTCAQFKTKELQREADARRRREAKARSQNQASSGPILPASSQSPVEPPSAEPSGQRQSSMKRATTGRRGAAKPASASNSSTASTLGPSHGLILPPDERQGSSTQFSQKSSSQDGQKGTKREAKFSLHTYKHHSLGDYVETIGRYGTTDSYSTEPGELEHRTPKARYKRTSRKVVIKQMTQIERRQARIRRIRREQGELPTADSDIANSPNARYQLGNTQNFPEQIPLFLQMHSGDPAIKDFMPTLKAHLLSRIKNMPGVLTLSIIEGVSGSGVPDGNLTLRKSEPGQVLIRNDRMYRHKVIRFNYTTYDVRRVQDVVNPNTSHANIMVLAPSDDCVDGQQRLPHKFWYARVLGIYHVNAVYVGPDMVDYTPRRLDFLWVRWYHLESARVSGWPVRKLHRLSFPPMSSDHAFGFLDPADVLRSCHIIPAFARGRRYVGTGRSGGLSACARDSGDWNQYYVGQFVDRDMLMRDHWGYGVGHTYAYQSREHLAEHQTNWQNRNDSLLPGSEGIQVAQDTPPALTVANHVIEPHEQHSHGDDDAGEHGLDERENEDLGSSSDDEWQYDDREDSDDEVFSAYHF